MLRKNELNICSYKCKNRLTTTRTKEEILICSLWHLLEVVFRSSEVVQIEHCRATRSPLGNKLKDAVVLYVPMIDPYRSPQRATTNYSKIGLTNCISPKMSTQNTARVNTVQVGTKLHYVILWDVPKKDPSRSEQMACTNYSKNGQRNCGYEILSKQHCPRKYFASRYQIPVCCSLKCSTESFVAFCSKCLHQLFENLPKYLRFPKVVHIPLPEQILHQQAPNSSMLFFEMFQRNIHSVLFKVLAPTVRKSVKVIVFPKSCPHSTLPEQILHQQAPNSSMSFFGLYQRYSHSVLFKVLARNLRKSTKEIVFPKIVHIKHCPSKYFAIRRQISVCCSLEYSK